MDKYGSRIAYAYINFHSCINSINYTFSSSDSLSKEQIDEFFSKGWFTDFRKLATEIELKYSQDQFRRIDNLMRSRTSIAKHEFIQEITKLEERFRDELGHISFLFVQGGAAYANPLKTWDQSVQDAFPSCKYDMEEAYKCFAVGHYTASVFHLMRVLEKGLHAFAKDLKVSMSAEIEVHQWNDILNAINTKIKGFSQLPKSSKKSRDQEFYASGATQFDHFKNAWRNHVAHARSSYGIEEARMILLSVKQFMKKISERIKE